MDLKDKLPSLTIEDKLDLLASDGRLVKRPIVISDNATLVGFKADNYKDTLLK